MTRVIMKDIYGTEIDISESVSGHFRLDFKGDSFPQKTHSVTGEDIPTCVSIPFEKAKILSAVLSEYLEFQEEEQD